MENAKEKEKLNDDLLDQAAGGYYADRSPQRFHVEDRVKLVVYPENGVGEVIDT